MKKNLRFMALLTMLAAVLAFAGCSNPNSSDDGANSSFAGTTWKQSLNGSFLENGGAITFANSGNRVTLTINGISQVYDYTVIDSRTARFTVNGYGGTYMDFIIDSSDENKATWSSCEFTRQR